MDKKNDKGKVEEAVEIIAVLLFGVLIAAHLIETLIERGIF